MASILVILGGVAGLAMAGTALAMGAGPLAALAVWMLSGLATVGLVMVRLPRHEPVPVAAR